MDKCGSTFFHLKVWPIINPKSYLFLDAQVEYKLLKNNNIILQRIGKLLDLDVYSNSVKQQHSIIARRTAEPVDLDSYSASIKQQRRLDAHLSIMHFNAYGTAYFPESINNLSAALGTQDMEQVVILLVRSHKELLISRFSHLITKGSLDPQAKLRDSIRCSRSASTLEEINSIKNPFNVDRLNYPIIIKAINKHVNCKVFFR